MSFRRPLLRAVVEHGTQPCFTALPATAALVTTAQLRSCFFPSPIVRAPRSKTSAKKAKAITTASKRAKTKVKPPQPLEAATTAEAPAAVARSTTTSKNAPPSLAVEAVDAGESGEVASPTDTSAVTGCTNNAAALTGLTTARPAYLQLRGSHGLRMRRFLVGAHAALEGNSDCPDPRQHVPHLTSEELPLVEAEGGAAGQLAQTRRTASVVHHLRPSAFVSAKNPRRGSSKVQVPEYQPLSLEAAISAFANIFAFTLHTVPPQSHALAATSTTVNPLLNTANDGAAAAAATTSASLSFLSSPMFITSVRVLANRSPFGRAIAMDSMAPLHWLEHAFEELGRRVARELHEDLHQHDSGAGVCRAVRAQAAAVMSALEDAAKCASSRSVVSMRRQVRRERAAAAAAPPPPTSARKRKSHSASTTTDTSSTTAESGDVQDTLSNTVGRVTLQLHLLHVWLTRLCVTPPSATGADVQEHLSEGSGDGRGTLCVEAVVRQALRWGANRATSAVPSVTELQWMLATAMLEELHRQPFHIHVSRVVTTQRLAQSGARDPTCLHYTVHEKRLRGLAALVDFALAERDVAVVGADEPLGVAHATATTTAPFRESLFALLTVFHTVLPVYAVLQPAWRRVLALEGDVHTRDCQRPHVGMDVGDTKDAILAASPTAVWDVVAQRWTVQEGEIRAHGALAALWWLRFLPLWLHATSCTLQLRVVASATSAKAGREVEEECPSGDTSRLVQEGITQSLDAQLVRAGDLLRDVLRFDRVRYERTRIATSTAAAAALAAPPAGSNTDSGGQSPGEEEGEMSIGEVDGDANSADAAEQAAQQQAAEDGSPPPLLRNRGKRSLFYKSGDGSAHSILQGEGGDDNADAGKGNSGSSHGRNRDSQPSRFVSRMRHPGVASTLASRSTRGGSGGLHGALSTSAGQHHHHHRSAASAEAYAKTSALFDVFVLSTEAPILLTHRFAINTATERNCALEEAWAAAARAKTELWQLLYALPSPAAAETAVSSGRSGSWTSTEVMRSFLPPALHPCLTALRLPTPATRAIATAAAAAEERVLRDVLAVVESMQRSLSLDFFESLEHVLVALAQVLLRIHGIGHGEVASPPGTRPPPSRLLRAQQHLSAVLALGGTTMLAENLLSWDSMQAAWELRQLHGAPVPAAAPSAASRNGLAVVAASAAMHAFATQWTAAASIDILLVHMRARQDPVTVLANAKVMLEALRSGNVAPLPLHARQVTMAMVLHSLHTLVLHVQLPSSWKKIGSRMPTPKSTALTLQDVLTLYQQLLDTLARDVDLRLLCCFAAFVDGLFDVHRRLQTDHVDLIDWSDRYLLPLVLPVIVAGLRRSLATHSAATHFNVCEMTLVLLSPLSRYATTPRTAPADVLRSRWNRVLLQVSIYCVRIAGRGGVKRASDYGMPPVVLPDLTEALQASPPAPETTSQWWKNTFGGGAEPLFIGLLDQSNAVLWGTQRVEPHSVDVAAGVREALSAYVDAWGGRVRFGRRVWGNTGQGQQKNATAVTTAAAPSTQALLLRLQRRSADVDAYAAITQPARTAGAEAAPFLATKPAKARQLGYLVRFMEHFLREQERLSRITNEGNPMQAETPTTPSGKNMADTLGETAALVLLDFVGHLSSAGGWSMLMWSCNVAETVIKIELKRHRSIPDGTRAVAATAILSQIRTLRPPRVGTALPLNLVKVLFTLSDLVGTTPGSLLGFSRRCPLHGLFSHCTREEYRVLTFGLKQATAYVQIDSRQYRAWMNAAEAPALSDTDLDAGLLKEADEVVHGEGEEEKDAAMAEMRRRVGDYFATLWVAHTVKGSGTVVSAAQVAERRGFFRFYVGCLVALMDACMEWVQLYLIRQQGDGEEDLRVVVEAAVTELCRTIAANLQSVLSLSKEQRTACFAQEEAELLWAALCVTATLSTIAAQDKKERFFTPRCTQAMRRMLQRTDELVQAVVVAEEGSDAAAHRASRPLCTALVRGVQLLLRDPHATARLSIRLAVKQREEDDLTAVLGAFHVLLFASRAYKPGSELLCGVWERLREELVQPLAATASKGSAAVVVAASSVASRSDYGAVVRGLLSAAAILRGLPAPTGTDTDCEETAATAIRYVVEDADAVQLDRRRSLVHLSSRDTRSEDASDDDLGGLDGLSAGDDVRASPAAATPPYNHLDIAAALESGVLPLSEVLDAAIAHAGTTFHAAQARRRQRLMSTLLVDEEVSGNDNATPRIGLARSIKDYHQDMTDLLAHISLREVLCRPNAELLFACLSLLRGAIAEDAEDALWRALTARWQSELIAPAEGAFLQLQEQQLSLVRAYRGVQTPGAAEGSVGASAGGGGRSARTPRPDILARATGGKAGEVGVSAAALAVQRDHWYVEGHSLPHHDDARRLMRRPTHTVSEEALAGESPHVDETFAGEFDAEATGLAALAAVPDPVPLPVLHSLLQTLSSQLIGGESRSFEASRHRAADKEARMWLGVGGGSSDSHHGSSPRRDAAVAAFVDVVVTYVARAYWMLRPRLEDSAWVVWATVERGMTAYPVANGVRRHQWDRLCRLARLPSSMEQAEAVAGGFLRDSERRRVAAWCRRLQASCASLHGLDAFAPGKEEVAVLCYLRAMALMTQLLAVTMKLLMRHRMLGDVLGSSPEVVSDRLRQRGRREHGGAEGLNEDVSRAQHRTAVAQEIHRLAQMRQAQPAQVNRNVLEGAGLQFLNITWTLVRHSDSITHQATDAALGQLTQARAAKASASASSLPSPLCDPSALLSYADEVRRMVTDVLRETLTMALDVGKVTRLNVVQEVTQTLLTSGFSCDPLMLPVPQSKGEQGGGGGGGGAMMSGVAPAVTVVKTLLNATASASVLSMSGGIGSGGGAGGPVNSILSPATAAAGPSGHGAPNPLIRSELYVGSPSLLALLTPHFIKTTLMPQLVHFPSTAMLLPVVSALQHYLSRRGLPLSPLLEATTELLTCSPIRGSALHTYCEHLASELTTRREFRQALEPPTIASVEQGEAGSISNEVVIAFVAAIARRDVHVTKKTLAGLLHLILSKRLDVFGQPPIANRQGKLTLVQVGTTVDATLDTTNPLYAPRRARAKAAATATAAAATAANVSGDEDDAAVIMDAFNVDHSNDFTAMTHHRALAALTITMETVMEVAMHIDAMRLLDHSEQRRAVQMLKAADDERRERIAVHRSLAQTSTSGKKKAAATSAASVGVFDASLRLADPLDFGVNVLHLRYALRKIVHASLRRLLHQQGPRMLADVAAMLEMVDPGMRHKPDTPYRHSSSSGSGSASALTNPGIGDDAYGQGKTRIGTAADAAAQRPLPYDGVLAGTIRVLLSRAVLCAQAIGYDTNGAALELPMARSDPASPLSAQDAPAAQPVLKLPVPSLQVSAVEAAIAALGSAKGRHATVGSSSGRMGLLTKEEKAAVHQRVELEREAAVTVGTTTQGVHRGHIQRIVRAIRQTRHAQQQRQWKRELYLRRSGAGRSTRIAVSGSSSSSSSSSFPSASVAGSSSSRSHAPIRS